MSLELPKGSINIGSYIYHGVFPYFFPTGFLGVLSGISIHFGFFPQGFSKALKTMTDKHMTVPTQDQLIKGEC
jgi:hypothetical protein